MTILIGGAAAGRWIKVPEDRDYYAVVETAPVAYNDLKAAHVDSLASRMKQTIYKRMELFYAVSREEPAKFVFYVDRDRIRDEYDLIRELANGYHPVQVQTV